MKDKNPDLYRVFVSFLLKPSIETRVIYLNRTKQVGMRPTTVGSSWGFKPKNLFKFDRAGPNTLLLIFLKISYIIMNLDGPLLFGASLTLFEIFIWTSSSRMTRTYTSNKNKIRYKPINMKLCLQFHVNYLQNPKEL